MKSWNSSFRLKWFLNIGRDSLLNHSPPKIYVISSFFLSEFSSTKIHDSQGSRWGEGEAISLNPLYHFHPLHRYLNISRAITAESSPLDIAGSRTRIWNLWFPSASGKPLSYVPALYWRLGWTKWPTWDIRCRKKLPNVWRNNISFNFHQMVLGSLWELNDPTVNASWVALRLRS